MILSLNGVVAFTGLCRADTFTLISNSGNGIQFEAKRCWLLADHSTIGTTARARSGSPWHRLSKTVRT